MRTRRIAITGGIGAGKSIVSRILEACGYPVYDCDSRAKNIMDSDSSMTERIRLEVHPSAVADGRLDRQALAKVVFGDAAKLQALNAIVHAAVRRDLEQWFERQAASHNLLFVETAILHESGLDAMVDGVWIVDAPAETRIQRVMRRNGLSRQDVQRRMASQQTIRDPRASVIVNDDTRSLLLQIDSLLTNAY